MENVAKNTPEKVCKNIDVTVTEETEFILPNNEGYTIYSKSGCPNCILIKKFLCEKGVRQFTVNCDEYLLENKFKFLKFIESVAEQEVKLFPMIFFNGKYIGGCKESMKHYEQEEYFSDKNVF
uniref:Glutaredoxin domain-containing protein n=1 Tax=viral metagenome TaxID=1070528 RepID=A0A6C0B246_9ZZZZ